MNDAHVPDGSSSPDGEERRSPSDGTAEEWEVWMKSHMTEHVGPGSVAWMESHMGVTVAEMAQYMADGNDTAHGTGFLHHGHAGGSGMHGSAHGGHGAHTDDTYRDDTHRGGYGMAGRGHGC